MAKRISIIIAILIVVLLGTIAGISLLNPQNKREAICRRWDIPYKAVIAHRGASFYAPEETEPAYLLARDLGADYLEADIQRTKDGVLIALHDDTLERTTNVKTIFPGREKEYVERFTLAELRKLDAGSWFNAAFPERARKGYEKLKILTLEDILHIAKGGTHKPGIYLEIKSPKRFPGIAAQLVETLTRHGWLSRNAAMSPQGQAEQAGVGQSSGRVILQSFDPECVADFARLAPQVPRLYLYDKDEIKERGWDRILATAIGFNAGLGPSGYVATPWKNSKGHSAGLFIHVYTINKSWQVHLLTLFGADGFFTDRADMLLESYGRKPLGSIDEILKKHGY